MTADEELRELRAQLDALQEYAEQTAEANATTCERYKTNGYPSHAVAYSLGAHDTAENMANMIRAIRKQETNNAD